MAVSIAQYVDLLFKKLQGVAKTANAATKSASNESIASPAFLRGDIIWMQSNQITATAQAIAGIANARTGNNSVQCVADATVPPIGGVYPTWKTNVTYWVPQEFGSTWLPKVYVGPSGAANIEATGTQIFAPGISSTGEYFFDTQAGVLNFIGETIPTVLTSGNVVYVSGYQYVGALGVTNNPGNTTIGNLTVANTTMTTNLANGNITLTATGTGLVTISGTSGVVIPNGNTTQRPTPEITGTLRLNTELDQMEIWDGTQWLQGGGGGGGNVTVSDQQENGDGSTTNWILDYDATEASILVALNGVGQLPGLAYTVASGNIIFNEAPATGDRIDIRFLASTIAPGTLYNTSGNTAVYVTDVPSIVFKVAASNVATIAGNKVFNINNSHSLQLPTYTVAQANSLGNVAAGQVIYVSNGDSGSACLAVYSGGAWKRVSLGATIST